MDIVHLASEFSPIAKVGGLADVTAGLSKSLYKHGENVEVILPFYEHIDKSKLKNLKVVADNFPTQLETHTSKNTIYRAESDGVLLTLVEPKNDYFKRDNIYGYEDDDMRFMYFTKVSMDYLLNIKKELDILHLHDWLTSLAAPLYNLLYKSFGLKIKAIVTNIHNMQYQGVFFPQKLSYLGINSKKFAVTPGP